MAATDSADANSSHDASKEGEALDPHGAAAESRAHTSKIADDEPEPTLEDDPPSDGRDHQGEAMIRDLPVNDELAPIASDDAKKSPTPKET